MKRYFGLLEGISKEFNIQRGTGETEDSWKARIIYSYLGQMAYSSLFDIQEDLSPSSIVHFKTRITETLGCLIKMYPELTGIFSVDDNTLPEEIYQIFLKGGCLYHTPNRICPCLRKQAKYGQLVFSRGQALEEMKQISGLGAYVCKVNDEAGSSFADMWSLPKENPKEIWDKLVSESVFVDVKGELRLEYLRITPPFKYGYWYNVPDESGDVSLARVGMPGNFLYFLYRIRGSTMQISQLPRWQTDAYEYRNLAIGNLMNNHVLPATSYRIDGELATVWIGYLYPPAEMNLMKLYSWPTSYVDFPHDFRRVMDREVFLTFRQYFSGLGYDFVLREN